MIELSRRDLEVYKKNLISRRLSFKLVTKRAETTLLKNGIEVARLKLNNNKRVKVKSEALSLFSSVKKSINKFIVEKKLDIEEGLSLF